MRNYVDVKELVGETLKFVDVGDDQIQLTTESGRIINIFHSQDCCESVSIKDTSGDWHRLCGKVLTEVTHEEEEGNTDAESSTLTTLTFETDEHTVINRWIGESNGYYSESVSLEELAKQ